MEGRNPVDGGLDCGLRRSDEMSGRRGGARRLICP